MIKQNICVDCEHYYVIKDLDRVIVHTCGLYRDVVTGVCIPCVDARSLQKTVHTCEGYIPNSLGAMK